jgi:hypothetical protein
MRVLQLITSRPLVPALLVGLLVSGAVLMFAVSRPAEYSARVGLLATLQQQNGVLEQGASTTDFPAVAAQSMPAIVEVAHSPSVLERAGAAVPGAPTGEELFDDVSVDLIPGSALARLNVRADSPTMARDLASAIAVGIVDAGLLAPVGTLRVIDDEPFVNEVGPDRAMSAGMVLAAGVAAAAVIYGLLALFVPSTRREIARALGDAGIHRPVPVIGSGRFRDVFAKVDMLATAAARRVRVVPLTPGSSRDAEKLELELATAGVRIADQDERDAAIVGVTSHKDNPESIRWAMAALPDTSRLIAIVLQ